MDRPVSRPRSRRRFLSTLGLAAPGVLLLEPLAARALRCGPVGSEPLFRISLAQWSLHRTLRAGELDPLDFPALTRDDFGLDAVEYVNSFYREHAEDEAYFATLRNRAEDQGVRSLLIMIDGEGAIGAPELQDRVRSVENHFKWVRHAASLGCHSVRVNARSEGTPAEQRDLVADGLRRLAEFADPHGINVLVENHGGLSSNGAWLAEVMRTVDHRRCGTLPDFGNFRIEDDDWYDRYRGVAELMPYAGAVSAKSHAFDDQGNERNTDYFRMMRIVLEAGYRGYVGIEYEGDELSEAEGIRATLGLLERVRESLAREGFEADEG